MAVKEDNLYYNSEPARDFLDLPQYTEPIGDIQSQIRNSKAMLSEDIDDYDSGNTDEGDGFLETTANLWRQGNVQGHSVNLNKKLQEYSDAEGKWLPEMEQAREYLQNKEQIRSLQSQLYQNDSTWSNSQKRAAQEQIQTLKVRNEVLEYGLDGGPEPIIGLRDLARTNPYLRDIFYDTSYNAFGKNALREAGYDTFSLKDRLKIQFYDFISDTAGDANSNNNLGSYISEQGINTPFGKIGGPTQEQLDYLWNLRNKEDQLDKQLEDFDASLRTAEAREYDKRSDIIAKINTIKKGNLLFDPTKISPNFKKKYEHYKEEGMSINNIESWVYALPELGSSYSEFGAMLGSMAASGLMNMAAKGVLTAASGGTFPLLYAVTEAGVNYAIQDYMRDSETKSEIFDASSARALQLIGENNIPLPSIVEQYKPILKEQGYPVETMTDQEIFNLSLIDSEQLQPQLQTGITPEGAQIFNNIRQQVLDDSNQAVIRQTNMALSVPDYLINMMTFSYGGKYLKNAYGLSKMRKGTTMTNDVAQTAYERALGTAYDAVPATGKIGQLRNWGNKVIDKTIVKNFDRIIKNPMKRVSANRILKSMYDTGKTMGISYFNERNEEGIQSIVSTRYQNGQYDNVQNYSLLDGLANAMQLGVEANLAYYGIHSDESLNTDKDLRNAMDVGGFTGLFMTGVYQAPSMYNTYKQVLTDQKLRGLISDRYGDAERDNKVEAFAKAGNADGKNFDRIRESLQSLKQHKPEGVTDQMIDEDIALANRVSFWLNNRTFKRMADAIGAKKGSKERTYMLQNLIDLQDRANEQGRVTNEVSDQLDQLTQELLTGASQDFDFVLGREYGNYVRRKRNVAQGKYGRQGKPEELKEIEKLAARANELQNIIDDISNQLIDSDKIDKATEKYRKELENNRNRQTQLSAQLQSDPISYQQYKKNIVDQILQVRAYKLLKQLQSEIESRKSDLQKLAKDRHLDVNLDGISGIGDYIDKFLKQSKPFIDNLLARARQVNPELTEDQFIEQALERYGNLPKQSEFDNITISRAINAGAYNDLLNHLGAYTTGVYVGDMRLYNKTFENLTAQEQAEISITPQEYNDRYAESESENEMDEAADSVSKYRKRAERVIERDLTRRQQKVNQAVQEKLEDNGTPIDQPVAEPIEEQNSTTTATEQEEQSDTGYTNGQESAPTSAINIDTSATTEQEQNQGDKSKLEAEIDALEETLGQKEQAPEQIQLDEEEVQNYEPTTPVEQVAEEAANNLSDSDSEQDAIRVREERAEVEGDTTEGIGQDTAEEVSSHTNPEDNTGSSSVQEDKSEVQREQEAHDEEQKTPVNEVPVPPINNKATIPTIEDVPNPLNDIPDNGELFIDPATDQLMYDPSGNGDMQNAITVEDSMLQLQNEFEAATDEYIVGPVAHQKSTANSDQINPVETSAKQKRRYIASTFFYPPMTQQVMPIQNYGTEVEFTTIDGKKATRKPGSELAERLANPRWLVTTDDAYYVVTANTHDMTSADAIDMLAVHLIIEKDGNVYNTELRAITPRLKEELRSAGMTDSDIEEQINKLRTFRNQIIKQYYPEFFQGKALPSVPLKHVKPVNMRNSNGSLNNQVNAQGLPEFRLLTEVSDFNISSDPQELTEALQNPDAENGVEIGFGAGPFATNSEPFSIQRLDQSGETSTQGRGYAGKLYYIPKVENTPSGTTTLPIMLAEELHKIPEVRNYTEIQLAVNADGTINSGVVPTTAELIFNLMTGVYDQRLPESVRTFLLDLLANTGPRTSTAGFDAEQSNRFNFLVRKQLLTFESKDTQGNTIRKGLVTSTLRQPGLPQYGYKPYITDLLRLINDSKKRAIWNISQNIHWNTDKDLLMSEFPQEFVDMLVRTYENYKGNKNANTQFPVFSRDLTFSLNDIGYTVRDGKVVKKEGTSPIVASWYINHGKIKTDLGEHAFFAPFVYTDGGRVAQEAKTEQTETKPVKKVTTSGKTIETKTPNKQATVEEPIEQQKTKAIPNSPTIALPATPENLQKYGLSIPTGMKEIVGHKWAIVPDKKNGGYKVTLAPIKFIKGFNSTVRGEGSFDRQSALKWLEDTLGITPENTDIIVVNAIASTLSDARIYGVMRVVSDSISGQFNPQFIFSNDAGKGIEYHEAFHYVTQLLLTRQQRAALYAEYERRHPGEQPRTKREVEELLAEEFRNYMLNEQKPTLGYRITKFFKNIVNYIKTLFGRTNIQDTLFHNIAKGKFKNFKPEQSVMKEFVDTYQQGLYYYIPGLTQEEIKKIPNITDGNTFYKVVDSLTSTVLSMYQIRSLQDVERLSIQGIFDQIQEKLDDGWITEENIPLVQDVLNNQDIFTKYILRKLRSLSIRESDTLETEEESRLETETGDNPDNNWDKNQGEHSKKKNIAFQAKLFFYSVPQYEWTFVEHEDGTVTKEAEPQYDDIFGFNIAESFNVVWNKIMNNLWNIDNYNDILREVSRLAKTDKTFYALDQMLNDPNNPIDDNTKTQLEVTIKSFKAEFNTISIKHADIPKQGKMSDQEYAQEVESALSKSVWEVRSSKNLRRIALYPRAWSMAFFSSSSVITDDNGNIHINKGLIDFIEPLRRNINKYIKPFVDKKYKGKKVTIEQFESQFQNIKDDFIKICNAISIPFDEESLDFLLGQVNISKPITGNIDLDRFITFFSTEISKSKSFSTILANIVTMSHNKNATIKSRSGEHVITADRLYNTYNYDAAINQMARAYGEIHPSQQEFSVVGADGALVYSISENNYTNDQIRNINQNKNGKLDQILNTPYSKRSLIANSAKNGIQFQLNSLLMVETQDDPGRDYFSISPIEDYITKLVLTFNDQMTLPTMSDKKTWYSISGLSLIKDVIQSSKVIFANSFSDTNEVAFEQQDRTFSRPTLDIFANMFLDEFDAVWDYYVHKEYVAKHPSERIDNYHGAIKNGVMQAGGNGGRFRYFSSLRFNDQVRNINHELAKLETEDTTEAVLSYLKALKMQLFSNDTFNSVKELDQSKAIFEAMNNFLVGATNRELKALVNRGIVTYTNGHYANVLVPFSVIDYYEKLIDEKNYSKDQKALRQEDILFSAIGSHVANTMLSIIEFEKCVTGDPAYYKHKTMKVTEDSDVTIGNKVTFTVDTGRDVDKIKRLSAVLSTGTNLRTVWDTAEESNRNVSVLTLKDNQIGSQYEEQLRSIFRSSLLRDLYSRKHPDLNDDQIIEILSNKKTEDEFFDSLTKDEKKYVEDNTENSVAPYTFEKDDKGNPDYSKGGSINQSDAAVYIRPAMYRRIMKALGNWSPEIEEAYRIMEGEDESWMSDPKQYIKVTAALAQPLKMVYFGDHFRKNTNLNVPIFDKMAMFPLFKALAKGDNRLLYDRMNNEELGTIDMIAFESAVKVGGTPKFQAYKDSNNETFNIEDLNKPSYNKTGKEGSLPVYNQDISNLRLQLNTEPHDALDRSFGTQATKICLANLRDDRTYGLNKGKKIKGRDLKKQVMAAINALTEHGRIDVIKRFFKNNNISNKALSDYLMSQAVDSNMPESFIEGLGLDQDGEFLIPLEATSNRRWIESRLISYVNKTVVDLNTRGGAAIQMSSFGFKATGARKQSAIGTAFNDGKPLSFLREDGSMEVMLSTNFFRHIVPKEFQGSYGQMRQWLMQKGLIGTTSKPIGIGYRIPTQGLSSTFSFVVADVLPDRFGDTIVVPDEFTAMTGSDFDVDKLYIAMLNTDKNGNIVQYKEGKDVSKQSVEALQNMVIQSYQTVVSDSSNMAETRASIDTLTQLLQKEILPKVQPSSKTEALPAYELLPTFQLARKEEYTSGKAGIGPFALNSTNHTLTQFVHLNMQYSQGNPYNLGQLDEINGRDGYRILDWLSAMINAHVDVAKDPYVITLNVNKITYNITNLLLRGGMGKNTFYFLAQPSLKRLANTLLANNGIYGAKQISEKELIRTLRKEYVFQLKKMIDSMEEGTAKANWRRKFNDVIDQYSTGVTPYNIVSDNRFVSTKYEDTFNEAKLSNALTNKDSIESIYQQLLVLNAYQTLSTDAKRLSDLVNRSQIDTKKYGNTLATQLNFKNSYYTFIEQNGKYFSIRGVESDNPKQALNTYFGETFLSKKFYAGLSLPRKILKNQLFVATTGFQDIFSSTMSSLLGNTWEDENGETHFITYTYNNGEIAIGYTHQSDKKKINTIAQYISAIIRTRLARNIPQLTATDEELREMFYGTNTMCKRWSGLKAYIRQHKDELPDLIAQDGTFKNALLNYLEEYPADNRLTFVDRIVPAEATMNNDADIDNRLTTAFAELLYHEDEAIRMVANDLAKYAYLTSYDERGRNTFFNLVPNQWKREVGYISAIKEGLKEFRGQDNTIAFQMVAESIDDYSHLSFPSITISLARNMWNDETIVPTLNFAERSYNMETREYKGDEKTLFYTNVKVGNRFVRVSDLFISPSFKNHDRDFIKVRFVGGSARTTELYQKVGSVGYINEEGKQVNMKPVYKRIPKLGFVDNRVRILELGKDSTEASAFPVNDFQQSSIYDDETIESAAIKGITDLSSKGLHKVYISSEAQSIGVREADQSSEVNVNSPIEINNVIEEMDMSDTSSQDFISDEQLAQAEAEVSSFVNISITDGVQDLVSDMDEVMDVMNQIDISQSTPTDMGQEQVEVMDMSMFTAGATPVETADMSQFAEGRRDRKTYSGKINSLLPNQVFVFGSNTQGRHGKGAALTAKNKFGAVYGRAEGPQGQSYAIITKDLTKKIQPSRTPEQIEEQISKLYQYARQNPDKEFLIAYSSTGNNLNYYSNQQMADMFASESIPNNIVFEQGFDKLVQQSTASQQRSSEQPIQTPVEAIDMSELTAMGKKRKEQCK